jgi:choline dehydrogenase
MSAPVYDTIIVGAGPAGCVLAARLTESPDHRVILIDAGADFGPNPANWPSELLDTTGPAIESHSWGYRHTADRRGRAIDLPRGRVFGGCSSVNSCIWLHGSRADYDYWQALGNPDWNYDALAPYFQRAEHEPLRKPESGGPVDVWRVPDNSLSEIDRALTVSADELGIEPLTDLNGAADQRPSIGKTPKNIRDGRRLNAALTYLSMARDRPNLTLRPDTLVDRIRFDGARAIGIRGADGSEFDGHEVIVCSGAYGSPAVLLRSGIGPSAHLRTLGIDIVANVPGVGENLMDHPYLAPYTSGHTSFVIAQHAVPERKIFIQTMIKARSHHVSEEIDLHLYPREMLDDLTGRWLLRFGISLQFSRSRGWVRLTSAAPDAPLEIDHRYFSDPVDLDALADGVELVEQLTRTQPLRDLLVGPDRDDVRFSDREALKEMIHAEVGTTFHPSSSCKMGPSSDPLAVVDGACRVRGVSNLRVVDASIFPYIPRCNLHAPTVAVAERMADLIRR